jgi:RNA recognition motif-containing protein
LNSALPEDADNAIKALNGTDLKGRKLKLESAVKKLRGKNAPKDEKNQNKDETDKTGDEKDDGENKTDADEPKKKREKKSKPVKADNGKCWS